MSPLLNPRRKDRNLQLAAQPRRCRFPEFGHPEAIEIFFDKVTQLIHINFGAALHGVTFTLAGM